MPELAWMSFASSRAALWSSTGRSARLASREEPDWPVMDAKPFILLIIGSPCTFPSTVMSASTSSWVMNEREVKYQVIRRYACI